MAKKLLHILRRCAVGQQIAGEGVAKLVEMKALHTVHSFLRCPAHIGNRCRRLIPAVRPFTAEAQQVQIALQMIRCDLLQFAVGNGVFLDASGCIDVGGHRAVAQRTGKLPLDAVAAGILYVEPIVPLLPLFFLQNLNLEICFKKYNAFPIVSYGTSQYCPTY